MKRRIKAYLDTSVASALFDERNPERKSLTEAFFEHSADFDVYVSELTVAEIERTPDPVLQVQMRNAVSGFPVLSLTDEVESLTSQYLHHGAVPTAHPEDAYHIAVAVVHEIDFLLSWNFKHLVRRKTRDIVRMVNTMNQYGRIEIMTPAELL